jgi:predicted phosphoadenosine phosphosulfate sulfurtransferase
MASKTIAQPSHRGLRILSKQTTLEAARARIKWIFDEFEGRVMVNVSGGKDSLVLLELSLEAARAGGYLPVSVYWLDQEAEWQSVVDLIYEWMDRPEVDPWLLQCPFRIFNATSTTSHWLNAWEVGKEDLYVHPRHPKAITVNTFGTDRFYELFAEILHARFGDEKCVALSGVRAEEARTRFMGTTHAASYKWITWGGRAPAGHPNQTVLYPLYDWTYLDVWKCIHEHGWPYAKLYDQLWQRGGHPLTMRVSNLTHENAVAELFFLQEVEPDTFERLICRMEGTHMAAMLGLEYFVHDLPFMFESWREYRDHLLKHLVDPEHQAYMAHLFARMDRRTPPGLWADFAWKAHCRVIMLNDVEGKSLAHNAFNVNFRAAQADYLKSIGGAKNLPPLPPSPPVPKMPYS